MFKRSALVGLMIGMMLSGSSVFAGGGNGGVKRDSTVKVINNSLNPVYAFVDVASSNITTASTAADPIAAFKALGGKEIAAGGNSASFSVKAGSHTVTAVDIVSESAVFVDRPITTSKGRTSNVTIP